MPLPLPSQLQQGMGVYEGWSKTPLQLDRRGPYTKPVQEVTFQGGVECIRGFMGFQVLHFHMGLAALSLSLYLDATSFIAFISFLKVGWCFRCLLLRSIRSVGMVCELWELFFT